MKINYNGSDITDKINLESCILTDRYGGLLDSIRLVINDKDNEWTGVKKGDEITVSMDGYNSGMMYLVTPTSKDSKLTLDAVSLKQSKKVVKSKIWRHVRLTEILSDCAKNNDLTLKTYGIIDYTYESVAQIQKTDLEFASMVCQREGYSVKVDDDCLIVFNEYFMESQDTKLTITPDDVKSGSSFSESSKCVSSFTVSYYDCEKGLIEQTAVDGEVLGGSEIKNERVTSYDEAKRFAYGYLRQRNKNHITGRLTMPYNKGISAGTLFHANGFREYDGKYVVSEVSHNITREISSLIVRKVLNY